MVTSKGTYSKVNAWPRISNGPDLNHMIMGSEGNLGIITEAVIRVRPLPETRIYDSILFYDWEGNFIRKIDVEPTEVYWSDGGEMCLSGVRLHPPAQCRRNRPEG